MKHLGDITKMMGAELALVDVKKAQERAQSFALDAAWAIFFTALRDKEGFGEKRLRRVWDEVNAISDSIRREYITVADLQQAIKEEAGIVFGGRL